MVMIEHKRQTSCQTPIYIYRHNGTSTSIHYPTLFYGYFKQNCRYLYLFLICVFRLSFHIEHIYLLILVYIIKIIDNVSGFDSMY